MKTTVIYHSADFDGLFCREIARKFLPDAELIGWDFGDAPIEPEKFWPGKLYILDLPCDAPFGTKFPNDLKSFAGGAMEHVVWIDHHASSIASHPTGIPGYRIDGVAACRLAWQWFWKECHDYPLNAGVEGQNQLPAKRDFIDRLVIEPIAVRLAGEYDVFDKRDTNAELFQHGLRSEPLTDGDWYLLLGGNSEGRTKVLLENGKSIQYARTREYRDVITQQGFDLQFEGLNFLACNSHELDIRSQLFEAGIKPNHDALLGYTFTGKDYRVSLYRIPDKEADILSIAKKYGGGGHVGACGFHSKDNPFTLPVANQ